MQKYGSIQRYIVMLDCVVAGSAPVAADVFRGVLESRFDLTPAFAPYAVTTAVASIVLLWWLGVSRAVWCFFGFSDAMKALQAIGTGIAIGAVVGFAYDRLEAVPRSVPFIQLALQVGIFVAVRHLAQKFYAPRIDKPANPTGVLVVGCNRTAETYLRAVELLSSGAMEVVGVLSEEASVVGLTLRGKKILGTVNQARDVIRTLQVHGVNVARIVMTLPDAALARPQFAALDLAIYETKIPVLQVESLFGEATSVEAVAETAFPDSDNAYDRYGVVKHGIDLCGSLILLILTSPLFVAVALLTLVDVGRPIYFWQQRMGRRGRSFLVYKFRTMRKPVNTAGEILDDCERTSRIGRFVRTTRLDELPQLWHILCGDMSFIGPRPLLPADQPEAIVGRLSVRPGLTGWAQVNGGKLVSPEEKGALDLYYVTNASLWLDLKIVWMTILMFARGDRRNEDDIALAVGVYLSGRPEKLQSTEVPVVSAIARRISIVKNVA